MSELSESVRSSSSESLQSEVKMSYLKKKLANFFQELSPEVKFTINIVLNNFFSTNNNDLEFPSSLSSTERAYVRKLCELNDIVFETRG